MLFLSLVFSITCLLIIVICIARVSYLYGQIKSDDEWKVKYEKLYSTATAEILKAKGYSPTINDMFPKAPEIKMSHRKIKPLEKINKEKPDPSIKLRIVKTEENNSKDKD